MTGGSRGAGPIAGVGLALRDGGGRVLLLRRRGSHGEGTWGLVGGHVEWGRTPARAMADEALEEVGVVVDPDAIRPLAFVASTVFAREGRHYLTLFGEAALPAGAEPRLLEPDKADGLGWLAPGAPPSPLFPPYADLLASGWGAIP